MGLIDLTQGELGTRGSVEIRKQEATEAAKLLNASAKLAAMAFVNDEAHQLEVIKTMRPSTQNCSVMLLMIAILIMQKEPIG